jgi:hypothetical protein
MTRQGRRGLCLSALAGLLGLAACTYVSPGVGFNTVLGYRNLGRDIERFYRQRAWERNATCPMPRIDAILAATVVEETEDEIVALVRYSWRDETRLDNDNRGGIRGRGGGGRCRGIDERRFTLEKLDGDVRVVAMSGPQRPNPIPR